MLMREQSDTPHVRAHYEAYPPPLCSVLAPAGAMSLML